MVHFTLRTATKFKLPKGHPEWEKMRKKDSRMAQLVLSALQRGTSVMFVAVK